MPLSKFKFHLLTNMITKIDRKNIELDANGQSIGRLASEIAQLLLGKGKASYEPHVDHGDNVNVSNLLGIKFSGDKMSQKKYYRHSTYPGGLKTEILKEKWNKNPEEVLRLAVKRMLPSNKLRNERMKRLTITK